MTTLANVSPIIEVPAGIALWAYYPERAWPVRIVGNTVAYAAGPVDKDRSILVEYERQDLEEEANSIRRRLITMGYLKTVEGWNPKDVGGEA